MELIEKIIKKEMDMTVTPDCKLESLGDSLDLINLFMMIEEKAGIKIPQETAQKFLTVGDVEAYLHAHVDG